MCCGNKKSGVGCKEYIFLWWDGVSFFGPDYTKLARLSGTPVRWFDKCKSLEWLFPFVAILAIAGFVIGSELNDVGSLKSQSLNQIHNRDYNMTIEHLSIIFTTEFNKTDILNLYVKQQKA